MRKKIAPKTVQKILDELFPNPEIPLKHKDPYTLLIAVILSAQCTDARVNQITPKLFAKASSPKQMTQLTPQEIEAIIRPCGLGPSKAKALWQLSKILIEKHHSQVPKTFEELEALPGVGHKTASVLIIQAFHTPAFPVDTHIHRCAKRWGLSDGSSVLHTEKDLKKLFPPSPWAKLHLQIIYFARQYCTARAHYPPNCPLCSLTHDN